MWGGAFDPELGYYIINTTDSGALHFIENQPNPKPAPLYADPDGQSPLLYSAKPSSSQSAISFSAYSFSANGWPCWAPPWGRLTAVDVNTGDIAWQVPYGTMAGIPADIKTGAPSSRGGPTTTAGGLIFMTGTLDQYFRALETKTGKELWSFKLDQAPLAIPIVYTGMSGREYVAVAAGEKLVAFALDGKGLPGTGPSIAHVLPEGNGRDLVQKVCNSCHSVDLITTHPQTRDEWTGTVQRMAQHGASATDEQFNEIVDYLTNNFGRTPDPKE
jgi:quinoprotein glucose dehydrogenase